MLALGKRTILALSLKRNYLNHLQLTSCTVQFEEMEVIVEAAASLVVVPIVVLTLSVF